MVGTPPQGKFHQFPHCETLWHDPQLFPRQCEQHRLQTPQSAGPLAESCCLLKFLSAPCLRSRCSSVTEQVLAASNLRRRQQQQRPHLPCNEVDWLLLQSRNYRRCKQQGHLPDTASSDHNRKPLAGVYDRKQSCKLQAKKDLQNPQN